MNKEKSPINVCSILLNSNMKNNTNSWQNNNSTSKSPNDTVKLNNPILSPNVFSSPSYSSCSSPVTNPSSMLYGPTSSISDSSDLPPTKNFAEWLLSFPSARHPTVNPTKDIIDSSNAHGFISPNSPHPNGKIKIPKVPIGMIQNTNDLINKYVAVPDDRFLQDPHRSQTARTDAEMSRHHLLSSSETTRETLRPPPERRQSMCVNTHSIDPSIVTTRNPYEMHKGLEMRPLTHRESRHHQNMGLPIKIPISSTKKSDHSNLTNGFLTERDTYRQDHYRYQPKALSHPIIKPTTSVPRLYSNLEKTSKPAPLIYKPPIAMYRAGARSSTTCSLSIPENDTVMDTSHRTLKELQMLQYNQLIKAGDTELKHDYESLNPTFKDPPKHNNSTISMRRHSIATYNNQHFDSNPIPQEQNNLFKSPQHTVLNTLNSQVFQNVQSSRPSSFQLQKKPQPQLIQLLPYIFKPESLKVFSTTSPKNSASSPCAQFKSPSIHPHDEGGIQMPLDNNELLNPNSLRRPTSVITPNSYLYDATQFIKNQNFTEEQSWTLADQLDNSLQMCGALVSLKGIKSQPKIYKSGNIAAQNQDRAFFLKLLPNLLAFAVFDGHGEFGHSVADFVSEKFQKYFIKALKNNPKTEILKTEQNLLQWMNQVFDKIDKKLLKTHPNRLNLYNSGTTGSVALCYNDSVYVGYVGDSKVVGYSFKGLDPIKVIATVEHNPIAEDEYKRIEQNGGKVSEVFFRHLNKAVSRIVEAGISVSRSFGDLEAREFGLICEPEFVKFIIEKNVENTTYPLMLILATDGLWDTLTPQEALKFFNNKDCNEETLMVNLKKMATTSWKKRLALEGRSDDTTAIVALLRLEDF